MALGCLGAGLAGGRWPAGKSSSLQNALVIAALGLSWYVGSYLMLLAPFGLETCCIAYILLTISGLVLSIHALNKFISPLSVRRARAIFNKKNESFPQQERPVINRYSLMLRARYRFQSQIRSSCICNVNPFRGTVVWGSPGSGKTYYIIRPYIEQSLQKGYTLFAYDFKFPSLTRIVYNNLLLHEKSFPVRPSFYVIDFDHLSQSNRCNPLDPGDMRDDSDAAEAARTILLALNREWISRQGDFWVESAISFVSACIWFLRKWENGQYCTLPHLVELMQLDYFKLFSVLQCVPEVETKVNPFVTLLQNNTLETLDSQIASARIALSMLASPRIYYVLSGNEFRLNINNPAAPKIVCVGSNAQKQQIYGAVLSLFISRMVKLVNKPDQLPCHIVLDELTTTYFPGIPNLLATARSNKVAVTFTAQSIELLRNAYGRDQANALFSLPGNVFCGQANNDMAKLMSDCIGRIIQSKESISENSRDSSVSQGEHLDLAVPPSKITTLSAGEFVGYVADDPEQKIELKAFHCEILNDHTTIRKEEALYTDLPEVREEITTKALEQIFLKIKNEVIDMVDKQLEKMRETPELVDKIIVKKGGE